MHPAVGLLESLEPCLPCYVYLGLLPRFPPMPDHLPCIRFNNFRRGNSATQAILLYSNFLFFRWPRSRPVQRHHCTVVGTVVPFVGLGYCRTDPHACSWGPPCIAARHCGQHPRPPCLQLSEPSLTTYRHHRCTP